MGLDALADNIISAKSPDDDKEYFDENEFLDLNEDTDPATACSHEGGGPLRNLPGPD